jgi:hypothetical protein
MKLLAYLSYQIAINVALEVQLVVLFFQVVVLESLSLNAYVLVSYFLH